MENPTSLAEAVIMHADEDADFDQIFSIRAAVFEEEMGIAEEAQIDGFDAVAHHYIMALQGKAIAVSRWRVTLGGNIRLERLAVLPEYRRLGAGKALMEKMLRDIPKARQTFIECTTAQVPYFEQFGFRSEGEAFDFHGILQQRMSLQR